ncbi:MAG: GIY-YIG nuclease family protein [Phycisphaerales bacterium]
MPSDCFFVYVLRSAKTGRRYVGSTEDVHHRLHRHNAGHSKSTKAGAPWTLIHTETFPTRGAAVEREMFLKTGVGRAWLDAQLGSAVA